MPASRPTATTRSSTIRSTPTASRSAARAGARALWTYDGAQALFTDLSTPLVGPIQRTGPALAFDSKRGHLILFGGYKAGDASPYKQDIYQWSGTDQNWINETTAAAKPDPRQLSAMAYDSKRDLHVPVRRQRLDELRRPLGLGAGDHHLVDGHGDAEHHAADRPLRAVAVLRFEARQGGDVRRLRNGDLGVRPDRRGLDQAQSAAGPGASGPERCQHAQRAPTSPTIRTAARSCCSAATRYNTAAAAYQYDTDDLGVGRGERPSGAS